MLNSKQQMINLINIISQDDEEMVLMDLRDELGSFTTDTLLETCLMFDSLCGVIEERLATLGLTGDFREQLH